MEPSIAKTTVQTPQDKMSQFRPLDLHELLVKQTLRFLDRDGPEQTGTAESRTLPPDAPTPSLPMPTDQTSMFILTPRGSRGASPLHEVHLKGGASPLHEVHLQVLEKPATSPTGRSPARILHSVGNGGTNVAPHSPFHSLSASLPGSSGTSAARLSSPQSPMSPLYAKTSTSALLESSNLNLSSPVLSAPRITPEVPTDQLWKINVSLIREMQEMRERLHGLRHAQEAKLLLEQEKRECQSKNLELDLTAKELQIELREAETRLQELKEQHLSLQQQCVITTSAHQNLRLEQEHRENTHRLAANQLKAQLQGFQEDCVQYKAENVKLQAELKRKEEQLEAARKSCQSIGAQFQEFKASLEDSRKLSQELEHKYQQSHSLHLASASKLAAFTSLTEQQQEDVGQLLEQHQRWLQGAERDFVRGLEGKLSSMRDAVNASTTKCELLDAAYHRQRSSAAATDHRLKETVTQLVAAEERVRRLESENRAWHGKHEQAQAHIHSLGGEKTAWHA